MKDRPSLRLQLRTPAGLLVDDEILSMRAEDLDGWFGIRPGRPDLVAALPAGLLIYENATEERFVASRGGLLHLRNDVCRVMLEDAHIATEVDAIADQLEAVLATRRERTTTHRRVLTDLEREALRRLSLEVS